MFLSYLFPTSLKEIWVIRQIKHYFGLRHYINLNVLKIILIYMWKEAYNYTWKKECSDKKEI